jgi:amino-acid N-acetyltransferase
MIRALPDSERPAVLNLLQESGLPTADLDQAAPTFLGEGDEHGLAGVVGVEVYGTVGLLRSLAVRVHSRGTGLGTRLADAAEAWAAAQGIHTLYLLTTTAEGFFARRNYGVRPRERVDPAIQRTTEFTGACPASATVMCRDLRGA